MNILDLINSERQKAGVHPLSFCSDLQQASNIRAEECSKCWSHTRPNGEPYYSVDDRIYGENLGKAYKTPEALVNAWMNSPTHKAVMLDKRFKSACIGIFNDGKTNWYSLELTK